MTNEISPSRLRSEQMFHHLDDILSWPLSLYTHLPYLYWLQYCVHFQHQKGAWQQNPSLLSATIQLSHLAHLDYPFEKCYENPFENTHWRKVKQVQPLQLSSIKKRLTTEPVIAVSNSKSTAVSPKHRLSTCSSHLTWQIQIPVTNLSTDYETSRLIKPHLAHLHYHLERLNFSSSSKTDVEQPATWVLKRERGADKTI